MQDLITEFLASRRQAGLARSTLSQYHWHLSELAAWLTEQGVGDVAAVSRSLLRKWGGTLHDRWAPATVKTAVVVCRSFFAWCVTEGAIPVNPAAGLKTPAVRMRLQRTLTAAEIAALLAACDIDTVKGVRDAALVSLLADSGIRSAELLRLTPADLDLDARLLVVLRKGGNQGLAFYGEATAERLRAWLALRTKLTALLAPHSLALWVAVGGNTPGEVITDSGLRLELRKLGNRAGVAGVSPHAFRRAWACLLVEAGAPPRYIQGAAGWKSERQLYRYTQGLDLRRMASQFSPMDRLTQAAELVQLPLWSTAPLTSISSD